MINLIGGIAVVKKVVSRNDVKIFIFCTATGAVLQIISRQYVKTHPECLENTPLTEEKNPLTEEKNIKRRFRFPRGGAFFEMHNHFSVFSGKFITKIAIPWLAKNGLVSGILSGGAGVVSQIPATAISTYLSDAFPQNLPHLEKTKFILITGEKVSLSQFDQTFEYLLKILEDEEIPFEEKQKAVRSIFTKYLDLRTMTGRISFILCIVLLLYILSAQSSSGFYILLKNLIKAIKEGRISKAIGRAIVRKLKKKGIPVDPELLEAVNS